MPNTVYRRQFCDVCTQTEIPYSETLNLAHEQGNQPQTLGSNSKSKKKSRSSKSKRKSPQSKPKSKPKISSPKSNVESFTISSLNDVPPENLLHCTFHVEGKPVTFLVDTGTAISVIRSDKIGETIINKENVVSIVGVSSTQSSTRSFGTAEISLDNLSKFKFHVANLNIKADGILGNDFLSKYNAHIYVQSKTMRVRDRTYKLFFLGEDKDTFNINKQFIGRRSETVITCLAADEIEDGDAVVIKQNIYDDPDLIIPSALINVKNKQFIITCINCSNEDKTIDIPTINISPYDEQINDISNYTINVTNTKPSITKEKVRELIRRDHLNDEEWSSLNKTIEEFADIFHTEDSALTFTNHTKHSIPTTSNIPINTKTYRFPQIHQKEVKEQIEKMLHQKIIRHSTSPWSSPIWVVPKKLDASGKQKWRVVIDYRKLNDITIGDSYPLPNITDILDKLGHSIYFSTLDLASGFHQIELNPDDIAKTAFNTPYGHYEFLRMPFGLKNAPATFQRAMDSVLYGLQGERCFVYLDDIVVFASSLQEHEQKLTEVFNRLRKHGLKVQPDKCEFLRKEVAYLGHIISNEGVKPNPDKVQAVQSFPVPKTCKDIKSFLGLAGYYRRFIPNFSKITKPLTSLLKKDVPFIWSDDQQQSFDHCKKILTESPILQYPDFSKEFILTTDASIHAIGAILSQGEIGKDLPIAYASRTLNKAESNYSTIERELLAIVWAVKHFRPYLFGRRFKIVTDHKPLTWLFSVKDPGSRLVRWRLKLEEFDYEIIYKAGKNNTNADALSRPPIMNTNVIDLTSDDEQEQDRNDDYLQINYEHFSDNPNYSFDTSNLKTSPDQLLDPRHKNIFVPTCCETSENDNLFHLALDGCSQVAPYLEKEKTLYGTDLLISDSKQNIVFAYTRPRYFDPWDSESYFKSLMSCLQKNEFKTLHVPNLKNERNCKLVGNEQLRITAYLADYYECEITICDNKVMYPKSEEIPEILKTFHDGPLSGHRGIVETTRKIRSEYFWKGMSKEIKDYIENCKICQSNKIQRKTYKAPMVITSQSTEPFERVTMDLISYSDITGDFNKYILTLQDDLTRFVQAYPIPDKQATTVAKALLTYCQHFGTPKRFHSDQGGEFVNNVLKQLMKLLGCSHTLSTAYHPQTNGSLERFHATLRDHIRMYHKRNNSNWDQIVPLAIICHNTSVNQSTGYTPHELLFGHKPRSLYSMKDSNEYTTNDYLNDLNERLKISRDVARRNIEAMKGKAKERYDNSIKNIAKFNIGDKVMLKVPNPNNLDSKWEGPYVIIRIGFNENYIIRKSGRNHVVHANRLRPVNATSEPLNSD